MIRVISWVMFCLSVGVNMFGSIEMLKHGITEFQATIVCAIYAAIAAMFAAVIAICELGDKRP